MRLAEYPGYLRDTAFRFLPHRARTGLRRVGHPGPGAPVLVTGNFTLTVRRLLAVLRGRDAWVLVANSKGVNVWCASGGGHLTHHDVISALRVEGVAQKVTHREIILPQLCATGVEPRLIEEATGFAARWGPARLEDLPAFLDRGARATKHDRLMRFPLWERMEMATMWIVPTLLLLLPVIALVSGWATALASALALATLVAGTYAALPRIKVFGRGRALPLGLFALLGAAIGGVTLALAGAATPAHGVWVAATALLGGGLLWADLPGTTPSYPSAINTRDNMAAIALDAARCDGSGDCVMVCPRAVLKMNGPARKVEIIALADCIQCGACIVQCPRDALFFRYGDGRVVEAPDIRATRMNLLGKRKHLPG